MKLNEAHRPAQKTYGYGFALSLCFGTEQHEAYEEDKAAESMQPIQPRDTLTNGLPPIEQGPELHEMDLNDTECRKKRSTHGKQKPQQSRS